MSKAITEYGLGATIDGIEVEYQFSPAADFEKSKITLIKAGVLVDPEKSLSEKTKQNFKNQILEFERERQQNIFSAGQNFHL